MATIYRECEFKFKSESSWQMLREKKREFTVGRSRAREPDRADAPPPRRPRGGPSSPPATWMLRPCALKREVTSQSDTRLAVRVSRGGLVEALAPFVESPLSPVSAGSQMETGTSCLELCRAECGETRGRISCKHFKNSLGTD